MSGRDDVHHLLLLENNTFFNFVVKGVSFVHVMFSPHKYMQVWSILDLHYLNICSSIYWHLCDISSTQAEEQGVGL